MKKHRNRGNNPVKKGIFIEGMTCSSCEKIVTRQALSVKGVKEVDIDYSNGEGYVVFDPSKTDIDKILSRIEKKGYTGYILDGKSLANGKNNKWIGYSFLAIGILIALYFIIEISSRINLPPISQNMGYGLLFLVGLLTGFHCIAMCGGFVVSYTAKDAKEGRPTYKSHLFYGLGKVISYTAIGGIFGLVGSLITFTPLMKGIAAIMAGIFLVIFGISMLNILPALKKIRLSTPKFLERFVSSKSKHSSPFIIGLLNGLMIACGPLQAMYVMAAGTGSMIEGAKLLLIFGLGTLPVMLGFGYLTSFISSKATHNILKASGIIVAILGLIMLNRGLALTGTGYDAGSLLSAFSAGNAVNVNSGANIASGNSVDSGIEMSGGYQIIRMDVLASGWSPNKFVLKKGVPVKWIINGREITGCNNAIVVPKYSLQFDIKKGEQTIEFTPTEEGIIPFSCWMGMIRGSFIVKSDINPTDAASVQKELNYVNVPKGSTCGGSGGGCGCGSR